MAPPAGREATPPEPSCDIAVVGAGPVGLALAVLLGRYGWRIQVFDARPEPYDIPRAVHLDHQAARILQGAGVMEAMAARTEMMDAYEWQSAEGTTLLRIEGGERSISGWPSSLMFAQPDLERALQARLEQLPNVTLHRGRRVTGLLHDPEGVGVRSAGVEDAATAGPAAPDDACVSRAKWVIGCDGAHSSIRQLVGGEVDDFGYVFDWLVVDVMPHRPAPWSPLNVQRCDPQRPTTAVSGGPGRRRWEFMRLPGESAEELSSAASAWRLLEPWGVTPANAALERLALYRFAALLAQRWADGAVLLAGDAAHQMPPFAGQGLCSGLRDAANLAWKLDAVLAGIAHADLLDTYQSERAPQVRAEIEFSMALGEIVCLLDPEAAADRDRNMGAAAATSGPIPPPPVPPLGPGCIEADDVGAGELGVQGAVAVAGRSGRLDDVLDSAGRWVLFGLGFDPLCHLEPELARWFGSIGGLGCHLGPTAVVDLDGTYGSWFEALGITGLLQRPDFSVFGTAAQASGIDVMVRALRGALRSPRR